MADVRSNPPAVSVLMPVYNCGQFIDEAVECILRQTFTDFEFLIVDDASTDDTWERLRKYTDPRIRLFRNETNKGLAQNLNELLASARGEFIARMDGDDVSMLDRLERQVSYLQENPAVGVVGSFYLYTNRDGRDFGFSTPYVDSADIKGGMLELRSGVLHPVAMMRRNILLQVGGYRPAIGIAEDQDLYLRLRDVCDFHNLPVVLHKWRMHGAQAGTRVVEQQAAILMLRLYAFERAVVGHDSLETMGPDDLQHMRSGGFIMPRVGNVRQKRQIMAVLGASTVRAARPIQAYRLASAAIRTWPLSPVGYGIALKCFFSMQTYARTLRRVKNACGRIVYRALRVRP